jgi:hypothetical protein
MGTSTVRTRAGITAEFQHVGSLKIATSFAMSPTI